MIPFNKIYSTKKEIANITAAIKSGKICGDGHYTKACETFFEKKYKFKKTLLTSSCTHALELAALLIGIQPGDEVIMPSFSFVSMANAFILRGARIIFADSGKTNPNMDSEQVEALVTAKTKAIVAVHYGGIACDMDLLRNIADRHKIYLIEDAAHAIDGFYKDRPLGSFGHLGVFSFHETKNITCGEGGLLIINDKKFIKRAEILREKGSNRSAFIRKEIGRYTWVDIGSSFLASDISAAFLYAQLHKLDDIQEQRRKIWTRYWNGLHPLTGKNLIDLPHVPAGAENNAHIFYIICRSAKIRTDYIQFMLLNDIQVNFHYITLHDSPYYKKQHGKRNLPFAKKFQHCLVRLPIFYELKENEVDQIIDLTKKFFLNPVNTA